MSVASQTNPVGVAAPKFSWGFLRRLPWVAMIILLAFLVSAVLANWMSPYDPYAMDLGNRLHAPDWQHWMGTDALGRDILSRVIYGGRISLVIAVSALIFGGGLGLAVGIVAGYMRGLTDTVLMRLTDCFMALPTLLIALVFVITIGAGLSTVIIALAVVTWARFSRIVRSEVLLLRTREFVLQSKVAGSSSLRIMLVHILPNVLNTFLVLSTLQVSQSILTEASLSFLGAGISAPTPTWGNMVSDGRNYIVSAWWICVFPGLALALVVFSFNALGDRLRDRLDPRLRQL